MIMKKIFLFLSLSVCCLAMQAYMPLVKNGHIRTDFGIAANMGDNSVYYATEKYLFAGDTLIEGKTYHNCGSYLLREETENQKVYLFVTDSAKEFLLYDFSAEVGDSIYAFSRYSVGNDPIVITAIDTITDLAGNEVRQFMYVRYPYKFVDTNSYVEGYGAMDGNFIYYVEGSLPGGMTYSLRCWLDEKDTKLMFGYNGSEYIGEDCEGSGTISAVETAEMESVAVAYSEGIVRFSHEVSSVTIVSVDGRAVYSGSSEPINTISVKLSAGVYFVRCNADGKEYVNRIVTL